MLRNRSGAVAPCVDHQVRREIGHGVRPPPGEVQHLPRTHYKAHRRSFRIKRVFLEIGVHCEGVQSRAPFQGALCLGVVEKLVVTRWENGPAFLANDLVDEIVLAVNVTLSEGAWGADPKYSVCVIK